METEPYNNRMRSRNRCAVGIEWRVLINSLHKEKALRGPANTQLSTLYIHLPFMYGQSVSNWQSWRTAFVLYLLSTINVMLNDYFLYIKHLRQITW